MVQYGDETVKAVIQATVLGCHSQGLYAVQPEVDHVVHIYICYRAIRGNGSDVSITTSWVHKVTGASLDGDEASALVNIHTVMTSVTIVICSAL